MLSAGDPSPRKDGILKATKGIEVGHVFMLGTKYSKTMNASFLDAQGQRMPRRHGMLWYRCRTVRGSLHRTESRRTKELSGPSRLPRSTSISIPVTQSAQDRTESPLRLYAELQAAGFEVLWDDRDDRAGVKFNDADLMGAPFQVVVGDKGLAEGVVEVKVRKHRYQNASHSR